MALPGSHHGILRGKNEPVSGLICLDMGMQENSNIESGPLEDLDLQVRVRLSPGIRSEFSASLRLAKYWNVAQIFTLSLTVSTNQVFNSERAG